ncbi:MAG: hypothetical protein OXE92_05175 [Bacteroidetes bacterium]|nr:hypothetical protein [Bacteroidota bacterium]
MVGHILIFSIFDRSAGSLFLFHLHVAILYSERLSVVSDFHAKRKLAILSAD